MRCLLAIIMIMFLTAPAFADSYCHTNGPNNCDEQIADKLDAITRNAISNIHRTQEAHVFKTENDYILAAAAKNNDQINGNHPNSRLALIER